jgi:hypothetical protein
MPTHMTMTLLQAVTITAAVLSATSTFGFGGSIVKYHRNAVAVDSGRTVPTTKIFSTIEDTTAPTTKTTASSSSSIGIDNSFYPLTPSTTDDQYNDIIPVEELEKVVEQVVSDSFDEECLVDPTTGGPVNDICIDEGLYARTKGRFKKLVRGTLDLVRSGGSGSSSSSGSSSKSEVEDDDEYLFETGALTAMDDNVPEGELLEKGWEARGNSSALRRNAEVWKFAFQCVFKVLKARNLTKAGADACVVSEAKVEAALFIRDGLLRLGPTFVKLGQVVSTRTDVLPKEYTDVLKTLQDDVPGFSGKRAIDIISKELGKPCEEVFRNFSIEPLAAASLGQVHTAMYKGKKVAIKVQRAGLKELFDVDLKNLKKLAELLDKFDPKTDGKFTSRSQLHLLA